VLLDNQSPEIFGQTPWQTVGPFFHGSLPWTGGADLVGGSSSGEAIEIVGRMFDADGAPVPDALIEIWQANAAGRYHSEADPRADPPLNADFIGFGRSSTAEDGAFRFRTVRPGAVPGPGNALQAPHIAVGVLGRGLLKRLVTRIYFAGEPLNDADPILALVPATRRATLLASPEAPGVWRFDIHLAGAREIVFFEV